MILLAYAHHQLEIGWLLPSLILFIVCLIIPKRRVKRDEAKKEGVIDLYHHISRELWCTSETCRMLTAAEVDDIKKARREKRLLSGRFVKYEEGKTADIWNNGKASRIYGQSFYII